MNASVLRNKTIFWSRLGFGLDPVTTDENGDPVIYDKEFSQLRLHQDFYKKGVKIHSFILNSGWVGDGRFNFSTTDATMDAAVKIGPDVKLIPRIKLNAPVEWCKNNPEDVFVYYNGPRNVEEIRALVGTSEHDYLGYEARNGTYQGDPKYRRSNVNGKISLQSFSSDKWLFDAANALRKLVLHLEEKYPDKIIGYHIAYGTSGETVMWGRISSKYGDYGINNQKKFKSFLKRKYGIEAELPSPDERYGQKKDLRDFVRIDNKISRYYDEFTDEINSYAVEHFCKVIKDACPNRLTGVFYGYFMGVDNIAYTGHTEMKRLLSSPYVDFFAAPKAYFRCLAGDSCGEYGCAQSVNINKLWVDECDVRTHLAKDVPANWRSNSFKETENALIRELAKNLAHNSGFWLMDLGGNWYDSEEMMNLVERLNKINELIRKKEHKSVSDVLILVDEKSVSMTSVSNDMLMGYTAEFICNAKMTGVSVDIFRMADIYSLRLSRYKLVVFAHTLKLSKKEFDYIKSQTNAGFCFNYAVGCVQNDEFSLENAKAITDFELVESHEAEYDFPSLRLSECNDVTMIADGKGVAYKYVNGRLYVMNCEPYLNTEAIKQIEKLAHCHFFCEANCTVYADNRFIAVIGKNAWYEGSIDLGTSRHWKNLITGERGEGRIINIALKPYDTAFYAFD